MTSPTSPTTTRPAIGLSERLRERIRLLGQSPDSILKFMDRILPLIEEAAAKLDAQAARVKELEAKNANARKWQQWAEDERAKYEVTATRLQQERDKLRGMLLLCGELGGIGKDEAPATYLRRLIDGLIDAQQQRDEAYARAAKIAGERSAVLPHYDDLTRGYISGRREAAAAIRHLAAGDEEGK